MRGRMQVFAGTSNRPLAQRICDHLDVPLGGMEIKRFSNDNLSVQIMENVREADVFVLQSLYPQPSEALVELMIMLDALRSASAGRITAVIPHYSYARSDKKDKPRISIAARLVADVLTAAGADRFLTMTLHSEQVQGFFSVPVDQIQASPVIADYLAQSDLSNAVALVDMGQDKRAAKYAERLSLPVAVMEKVRVSDTEVQVKYLVGEVEGKDVIFFDDEISRGTSLISAVQAATELGARSVRAACTHGLFGGPAIEMITDSPVLEVVTTDTVDLPQEKRIPKITVLSVAQLFAQAIQHIHTGHSVSELMS